MRAQGRRRDRVLVRLTWLVLGCWLLLPSLAAASQNATAGARLFAVQAGRHDSEDKARIQAESLRKRGLKPYVFEGVAHNGSVAYAVRLEIFDHLLEALQAADTVALKERLPVTVTAGGSTEPLDLSHLRFYVQIGAFGSEEGARVALMELVKKGHAQAGLLPLHEPGKQPWIIVYASVHEQHDQASKAAAKYQHKERLQAHVDMIHADVFLARRQEARSLLPEMFPAPPAEKADKAPKGAKPPTPETANATPPAAEAKPVVPPAHSGKPAKPAPVPLPTPADAFPPPEDAAPRQ